MQIITNNIIEIRSKLGVSITIPVHNKVSILTGDSATGKSKMINCLAELLQDNSEIDYCSVGDPNKLLICKNKKDFECHIENIKLGKKEALAKAIVIIDRFDTMSDDKDILEFIRDYNAIFIVCAHKSFEQCGYSTNSMLGLKHDGNSYIAYKLFKTPGDYMMQKDVLI